MQYPGVTEIDPGAPGKIGDRNRQLAREVRRLETELNFLRTQPSTPRREPDVPGGAETKEDEDGELVAAERQDVAGVLASAPVYHADEADEDDPYTGGRAV